MCVVNVGVGGWFPEGQKRLEQTLRSHGYTGDVLLYPCWPPDSPSHQETPYAFKPIAVEHAMRAGYEMILWCDSSVWVNRPLDDLWAETLRHGHLIMENGWTNSVWCADSALGPLGITREEARQQKHIVATAMAFDATQDRTRQFIREWASLARDGAAFRGAWNNKANAVSTLPEVLGHRHDQTVASALVARLGMEVVAANPWFSYSPCSNPEIMTLLCRPDPAWTRRAHRLPPARRQASRRRSKVGRQR
jgi:hypothetical protein